MAAAKVIVYDQQDAFPFPLGEPAVISDKQKLFFAEVQFFRRVRIGGLRRIADQEIRGGAEKTGKLH